MSIKRALQEHRQVFRRQMVTVKKTLPPTPPRRLPNTQQFTLPSPPPAPWVPSPPTSAAATTGWPVKTGLSFPPLEKKKAAVRSQKDPRDQERAASRMDSQEMEGAR